MTRKKSSDLAPYQDNVSDLRTIERAVEGFDLIIEIFDANGWNFEYFKTHLIETKGILKTIEEIGEGVKNLSPNIQTTFAHLVDWQWLVDVRNKFAHEYMGYNLSRVWKFVVLRIPELKRAFVEMRDTLLEHGVENFSPSDMDRLCKFAQRAGVQISIEELNQVLPDGINTISEKALSFWRRRSNVGEPLGFVMARKRLLAPDFPYLFDVEHNGLYLAQCFSNAVAFPADFPFWDFRLYTEETFAHYMAKIGRLPRRFDRWDLCDSFGVSVAHRALEAGTLPEDFKAWGTMDDDDMDSCRTVAHFAAEMGLLPDDFDAWSLMDNYWESVAHVAVQFGTVPNNPKTWKLRGEDGWTVAHEMARCHLLPNDFKDWDLVDNRDVSVADVVRQVGDDLGLFLYPPGENEMPLEPGI